MSAFLYEEHLRDDGKSPTIAGDYHDDDAEYEGDLVTSTGTPVVAPPTVMVDFNHPALLPRGRLLSGSRTWSAVQIPDPTVNDYIEQLLPFDANRKHLHLFCSNTPSMGTPTTNNYVLMADAKDKLTYIADYGAFAYGPSTIQGFMLPTGFPVDLDDYTGALWVRPVPAANSVRLSFMAVTS